MLRSNPRYTSILAHPKTRLKFQFLPRSIKKRVQTVEKGCLGRGAQTTKESAKNSPVYFVIRDLSTVFVEILFDGIKHAYNYCSSQALPRCSYSLRSAVTSAKKNPREEKDVPRMIQQCTIALPWHQSMTDLIDFLSFSSCRHTEKKCRIFSRAHTHTRCCCCSFGFGIKQS